MLLFDVAGSGDDDDGDDDSSDGDDDGDDDTSDGVFHIVESSEVSSIVFENRDGLVVVVGATATIRSESLALEGRQSSATAAIFFFFLYVAESPPPPPEERS